LKPGFIRRNYDVRKRASQLKRPLVNIVIPVVMFGNIKDGKVIKVEGTLILPQ
jgi:hypothetical protein